jgi:spore coat polysaccharide biosynthesis protein SpsF
MTGNIVAVVQARMGSRRLPNKMMLSLKGYPVVDWIFRRLSRSRHIDHIVFAIPDGERDGVLELYLRQAGATVFRGSEENVLDRFYRAAKMYRARHVVRVCGDNPLVCPEEVDNLIAFYLHGNCDYAYNHVPRGNRYPDGLGAEIVSFEVLEMIHRKARKRSQQEHLFNYLWDNQKKFVIRTFDPPDLEIAHPEIRVDMDDYEDYRRLLAADIHIDMNAGEIVRIFREMA